MNSRRSFGYRWILSGLGLLVAATVVPGLHYEGGVLGFVILALILGLLNALVKPILAVLTCPLMLVTLGLFMLVLNALLLFLASFLGRSIGIRFYVDGFGAAFLGGIIISLVAFLASAFIHERRL